MAVVLAEQNLRADGDVVVEGLITKMNIVDRNQDQLLTDIIKELKKMNLHLSLMTDVNIRDTEVE